MAISDFRRLTALLLTALLAGCATTSGEQRAAEAAEQGFEASEELHHELITQADYVARSGDFETALAVYMEASKHKHTAPLWHRIGYVYERLNNTKGAARAYHRVIQLNPDNHEVLESLGQLYLGERALDSANSQFRKAIALAPASWRSYAGLGVIADLQDRGAEARDYYRKAIEINPNSAMVWTNNGYSHYLNGEYADAEAAFTQALKLNGDYQPAWVNFGLVAARTGDYSAALERLIRVQKEPQAYNDVGYIAMLNGDLSAAESLLNKAVQLSPTYYERAQDNLKQLRLKQSQSALTNLRSKLPEPAGMAIPDQQRTSSVAERNRLAPGTDTTAVLQQMAEPEAERTTNLLASVSAVEPVSAADFLAKCPASEWPSACRICAYSHEPASCFNKSIATRNAYPLQKE